jgi:hypothetical protein
VTTPGVRVNQVGDIPSFPKWATLFRLVSDANLPLEYQWLDSTGKVVHRGKTNWM